MQGIITNKIFCVLLLLVCTSVLLINSYELTFGVWAMAALITTRKAYSVKLIKLVAIPAAILLVAFVSSFFYEHLTYNFLRDLAYLLKPILGLLIGYNICKILGARMLNTLVYAGVVLAVIHLVTLLYYYLLVGIRDMNTLRLYGGYFDDLEVYVLIFIIFRKKLGIELSRAQVIVFTALVGFSLFLYLARTNIIQFFILFFAMRGNLRLTVKSLRVLMYVLIGVLIGYTIIYNSNPKREGPGLQGFFYKIKIAPIEPFKTKINKDDWKDWNDNYRSFENIITVRQVRAEGWGAIIAGKGMGSTIDLGRELWTNDQEFIRYIPTLHNAYMTVFLKSGLIGVFLHLLFIFVLGSTARTGDDRVRFFNYLLVGSAVYLILSNWVFMGLYLKLDNKSIVLGAILACRELALKNQKRLT